MRIDARGGRLSVTRRTMRRGRRSGTSLFFARRANRRRNPRGVPGGTSSTTTVTTTVTARVRGTPPGRGGDTAEVEEETREMELFAALEELVANH